MVTVKQLLALIIILVFALLGCSPSIVEVIPTESLEGFEAGIEKIRVDLEIPGMSACIVKDSEIVWSKGFGYADIEKGIPATNTTLFHIASLTKTFAAIITMQLVEEGRLDLETLVKEYSIDIDDVRVIHLLTHTSESNPPGSEYEYNGGRFALMDKVIESVSGRTFAELVAERIITPLELSNTAPNVKDRRAFAHTGHDYDSFRENMATPYEYHSEGRAYTTKYQTYFGTAGGLISSILDLGKYAIAIDQGRLLQAETWEYVFTPMTSVTTGKKLPYGIGWFIQTYEGYVLNWHYGNWDGCAALIIRVPEKRMTFIALANNNTLSSLYRLGDGDLTRSDLARLFLDYYVISEEPLP
jgi:CubicO group peptidase (beta-lactamase class C family)